MDLAVAAAGTGSNDLELMLELTARHRERRSRFMGYPVNLDVDHQAFGQLLETLWITVGDPSPTYQERLDLPPFEHEVVRFLAQLAGGESDRTYGYVTHGGTEANTFGIHLGRQRLPNAPLYYGTAAHYTVERTAAVLRMEAVPVRCLRDGRIDPAALHAECMRRPGRGAVVVATVGTTVTGAVDSLPDVLAAVRPAGRHHLHVDAALGGLVAAFAPNPQPWGFDAGADTVAVSGHKLIGCPVPCGIALARRELVRPPAGAEYLSAPDSTLACSRSALTPMLLWYALRRLGSTGLAARVHRCLATAEYAVHRLERTRYRPWRHAGSVTVVFDQPPAHLCRRWHLATADGLAHVVAMPHVTREMVDRLSADLA